MLAQHNVLYVGAGLNALALLLLGASCGSALTRLLHLLWTGLSCALLLGTRFRFI